MKRVIAAILLFTTILFTGCITGSKQVTSPGNEPVNAPLDFDRYDKNSDGIVDKTEFPDHARKYDPTIAGHVMMIIITSVCVLTFGLVIMTCSREKTKKNA